MVKQDYLPIMSFEISRCLVFNVTFLDLQRIRHLFPVFFVMFIPFVQAVLRDFFNIQKRQLPDLWKGKRTFCSTFTIHCWWRSSNIYLFFVLWRIYVSRVRFPLLCYFSSFIIWYRFSFLVCYYFAYYSL